MVIHSFAVIFREKVKPRTCTGAMVRWISLDLVVVIARLLVAAAVVHWVIVLGALVVKHRLLPWLQALHPLSSPLCPQGVLLDPLPALQSLLSCSVGQLRL